MISEEIIQTIMSYTAEIVILMALVFELYFFCIYVPKDEDTKRERIISRIIGIFIAIPLFSIILFITNYNYTSIIMR